MEIKKLFGRATSQASSQAVQINQVAAYQSQAKRAETQGVEEDSVTISSLSRQLSQLSAILADDEQSRAARVQEIKDRVQSGAFSADPLAVARSLVSFAAESQQLQSR